MNGPDNDYNSPSSPSSPWDDELFQSTLTDKDDVDGFDQPWNPWTLVVITFFFGVMPGLGLLAFNYQRLGIKNRLYPALGFMLFVEVLGTAMLIGAVQNGMVDLHDKASMRSFRTMSKIVFVGAALVLAQTQMKRFHLFQRCDLPGGKLLKPALLAIAIGLTLDVVEAMLVTPWLLKK